MTDKAFVQLRFDKGTIRTDIEGYEEIDGSELDELSKKAGDETSEIKLQIEQIKRVKDHSPILLLYPEPDGNTKMRPYPEGKTDYHPRTVELFLEAITLVRVVRLILVMILSAVLVLSVLGGVSYLIFLSATSSSVKAALGGNIGGLWMGGAFVIVIVIFLLSKLFLMLQPKGVEKIKSDLKRNVDQGLKGSVVVWRDSWLPLFQPFLFFLPAVPPMNRPRKWLDENRRQLAWDKYRNRVLLKPQQQAQGITQQKPADINPACYVYMVNKLHGEPQLAIQYWFFYFANDFWNFHMGDWEVVTVFLKQDSKDKTGYTPQAVAYSGHLNGRARLWDDVTRDSPGGTHPVVYVARGSHAGYFESSPDGYETSVFRTGKSPFFRATVQVSPADPAGIHRDYVPNVKLSEATESIGCKDATLYVLPYHIDQEVVPYGEPPKWQKWWWLRYKGPWGGIIGPPLQGIKWDDPWQWVKNDCVIDPSSAWKSLLR